MDRSHVTRLRPGRVLRFGSGAGADAITSGRGFATLAPCPGGAARGERRANAGRGESTSQAHARARTGTDFYAVTV
jgi:hypothetical protein